MVPLGFLQKSSTTAKEHVPSPTTYIEDLKASLLYNMGRRESGTPLTSNARVTGASLNSLTDVPRQGPVLVITDATFGASPALIFSNLAELPQRVSQLSQLLHFYFTLKY
ncbi:unnamed protein product [Haemonchus placei]|uniref:Uncharacterized protein n=1 Tax=Haemonchus placei TaxID=6290 RepID=A0A158QQ97_HAEPC|nr:unnamed protein product [Haemonchus placei]